jgi:hypothetical protein
VNVEATDRSSRSKQVETAPASVKVESTDRTSRSKQVETAPAPVKAKFNLTEPPVVYLTTGSQYIGRQVKRTFGKSKVIGTITGWLPPDGDDIALWHVEHVDGDEEDLEEFEVEKYILAVDDPESIAASEKRAAPVKVEATDRTSRSKQVETAPAPVKVGAKNVQNEQNEPCEKKLICEFCNKQYNSRNGLWKHKKICVDSNTEDNEEATDRTSRSKQVETAPAPVKVEATDRTSRSKQASQPSAEEKNPKRPRNKYLYEIS